MSRNLIVFLVVCVVSLLFNWCLYQKPSATDNLKLSPDILMTRHSGESVTLGKAVSPTHGAVIHFWATWCPPCVVELPSLIERASQEKETPFLLISTDFDAQKAENFLKPHRAALQRSPHIILIHDPQSGLSQNTFKIRTLPGTLFLRPDLSVYKNVVGPVTWDSVDLEP